MEPSFMVVSLLSLDEFNEPSLADELSTSQPTIHRIKNGGEPKYRLGRRIEALYQARFGSDIKSDNNAA